MFRWFGGLFFHCFNLAPLVFFLLLLSFFFPSLSFSLLPSPSLSFSRESQERSSTSIFHRFSPTKKTATAHRQTKLVQHQAEQEHQVREGRMQHRLGVATNSIHRFRSLLAVAFGCCCIYLGVVVIRATILDFLFFDGGCIPTITTNALFSMFGVIKNKTGAVRRRFQQ